MTLIGTDLEAGTRTARPRLRRAWRPVVPAVVAVGALGLLAVRDPLTPGHYPSCPFLMLTGWACPGCGSMRALYSLTQGDLGAMWAYNPLAVLAVVVLLGIWIALVVRTLRGRERSRVAPGWLLMAFAVGVVVYGVARNVPVLTPYLGPLGVG